MNENDFFQLSGEDLQYVNVREARSLKFKEYGDKETKPLVFLTIDVDERSGRINQIGAFTPEICYSQKAMSKTDAYIRCGIRGWSSIFLPVKRSPEQQMQANPNYRVFQTSNFETFEYFEIGGNYYRCLEEGEALGILVQYLTPIYFCLDQVTLVTFREHDIKLLLRKISEHSLTQQFMTTTTEYLTLLQQLTTPEVPYSIDELIQRQSPALGCLLANAAQKSRALANVFVSTTNATTSRDHHDDSVFNTDIKRSEFSALEEFYHMNYCIKLDEHNEENTSLYVGDLAPTVKQADLREKVNSVGGNASAPGECKIKMCFHPKTKEFLGYAYLWFTTHDNALKTLSRLNNEHLHDRPMRVVWHNKNVIGAEMSKSNVYLKFVPFHMDQRKLHDSFRAFGKVLSSKLAVDPQGTPRGFAFVQYETEESALRAISKMNRINVAGKQLVVCIKKSDEERKFEAQKKQINFSAVMIKTIGKDEDTLDLNSLFQICREIGPINHIVSQGGSSSAVIIVYDLELYAERALTLDRYIFMGKQLEVSLFEPWMMDSLKPNQLRGVRLFVGNLTPQITDDFLRSLFLRQLNVNRKVHPEDQGRQVISAKVQRNPLTGASLLYGYVVILSNFAQAAVKAVDGHYINNNKLSVFCETEEEVSNTADSAKSIPTLSRLSDGVVTLRNNDEASTSQAKPVVKKPAPTVDAKTQLANKLRKAAIKKKKDAVAAANQQHNIKAIPMTGEPNNSSTSCLVTQPECTDGPLFGKRIPSADDVVPPPPHILIGDHRNSSTASHGLANQAASYASTTTHRNWGMQRDGPYPSPSSMTTEDQRYSSGHYESQYRHQQPHPGDQHNYRQQQSLPGNQHSSDRASYSGDDGPFPHRFHQRYEGSGPATASRGFGAFNSDIYGEQAGSDYSNYERAVASRRRDTTTSRSTFGSWRRSRSRSPGEGRYSQSFGFGRNRSRSRSRSSPRRSSYHSRSRGRSRSRSRSHGRGRSRSQSWDRSNRNRDDSPFSRRR